MLDTSTRLLRLLSMLQMRRSWAGPELAERLDVTPRTLRRDIDRLRSLGYTITATSGPGGGYGIGQGAALPPLLLDDDDAVTIAVALRSAADRFAGFGERAIGALVKLEQMLPARLRRRVGALQAVTVSVGHHPPTVDPDVLTVLATACRDRRRLAFPYRDRSGRPSTRKVEPVQLAHAGGQLWYLVAWDLGREDWRTLRVDRIAGGVTVGEAFIPRRPPEDVARFVTDAITRAPPPYRARFKLLGSAEELSKRVSSWWGVLEPLDAEHCILNTGGDTLDQTIVHAVLCGVDFELIEPEELRPRLDAMAQRLRSAAKG